MSKLQLSDCANNIKPSPIIAVTNKFVELKAANKNIFDLGGYMYISYVTDKATLKDVLSRSEKLLLT